MENSDNRSWLAEHDQQAFLTRGLWSRTKNKWGSEREREEKSMIGQGTERGIGISYQIMEIQRCKVGVKGGVGSREDQGVVWVRKGNWKWEALGAKKIWRKKMKSQKPNGASDTFFLGAGVGICNSGSCLKSLGYDTSPTNAECWHSLMLQQSLVGNL